MSKNLELIATLLLLTVMSLLLFFGLGATTITDPEEALYAEVSREMYHAGSAVVPTLGGADFFEIPPLHYWTQMLGFKLFGINSLGARALNALCGLITVLILFFSARSPLGSRGAFYGALVLGSSVLVIYLSRVAMPDMLLTMFLVISVASFWHAVERTLKKDQGGSFLFWVSYLAGGCTMLSKGAFGLLVLMVTAVIYLVLVRRIGLLFRKNLFLPGAFIIVIVGCSWYVVLLGFIHPDGFELAKELFSKQLLGMFSRTLEGHSAPFSSSPRRPAAWLFPLVLLSAAGGGQRRRPLRSRSRLALHPAVCYFFTREPFFPAVQRVQAAQ